MQSLVKMVFAVAVASAVTTGALADAQGCATDSGVIDCLASVDPGLDACLAFEGQLACYAANNDCAVLETATCTSIDTLGLCGDVDGCETGCLADADVTNCLAAIDPGLDSCATFEGQYACFGPNGDCIAQAEAVCTSIEQDGLDCADALDECNGGGGGGGDLCRGDAKVLSCLAAVEASGPVGCEKLQQEMACYAIEAACINPLRDMCIAFLPTPEDCDKACGGSDLTMCVANSDNENCLAPSGFSPENNICEEFKGEPACLGNGTCEFDICTEESSSSCDINDVCEVIATFNFEDFGNGASATGTSATLLVLAAAYWQRSQIMCFPII